MPRAVRREHHYHLEKRSGREEVRLLENSLGKNNLAGLTSLSLCACSFRKAKFFSTVLRAKG